MSVMQCVFVGGGLVQTVCGGPYRVIERRRTIGSLGRLIPKRLGEDSVG